jgi:hypothetical protein
VLLSLIPDPFSRGEKGDEPLSLRERGRGEGIFEMTLDSRACRFKDARGRSTVTL